MIADLMTYLLGLAVLVIAFTAGVRIGRLMEQDAQAARAARRLVPLQSMMKAPARVPSQRRPVDGCHPDYHDLGTHAPNHNQTGESR